VPRNRGKNTTLLASMSLEGLGPSLALEGTTTATVLETYIKKVLAPSLRPGQLVVMDNLSAHKGVRIRQSLLKSGAASCCTCRPTPRPFPHRGGVQSKIKGILRKAAQGAG
jgi:hypothetical protein